MFIDISMMFKPSLNVRNITLKFNISLLEFQFELLVTAINGLNSPGNV